MMHKAILVLILAFVFLAGAGCAEADPPQAIAEDSSTWSQVLEMYEKAKAAGEQVPKDVYEWAKQDLGKIGDWEYLVTELPLNDTELVQGRLNELGAERWECIWIHTTANKTSFIFKRPAKSYLRNIPLSQLMKLVPGGGSDASGE